MPTPVKTKENTKRTSFFQDLFSQGLFTFEEQEPYFQEKLLQIIWNEQLLVHPIQSVSGEKIEVISSGTWNVEPGPDFHDAVIKIGEALRQGSIEIHLHPEDWTRHRHHLDANYDNMILHVVWDNPRNVNELPSGVPLFCLNNCLSLPLEEIIDKFDISVYPYAKMVAPDACAKWFSKQDDDILSNLIQSYGIARIYKKAQKFAQQIVTNGLEDTAYKALFEGMGYKNNRQPFLDIASRVSLKRLASYSDLDAQAVLFGTASLIPDPSQDDISPEYLSQVDDMWNSWWQKRTEYSIVDWKRSRHRPFNSPERRLLAAHIVLRNNTYTLGSNIIRTLTSQNDANECYHALMGLFIQDEEQWMRHFLTFSKSLKKPVKLLGDNRIHDLLINFALPFYIGNCIATSRSFSCEKVKKTILRIPKLQDNRLFKEAAHKFFIPPSRGRKIIKNACSQQGLLTLYDEFRRKSHYDSCI